MTGDRYRLILLGASVALGSVPGEWCGCGGDVPLGTSLKSSRIGTGGSGTPPPLGRTRPIGYHSQ